MVECPMKNYPLKLLNLTLISVLCACSHVLVSVEKKHSTDTHVHIQQSSANEEMKFNSSRALLAADSIDVERIIAISNSYSKMAYLDFARTQNAFVAKESKNNPKKVSGACAVNPLMDWAVEEMRRCKQDGLKVLKLHTVASGMDLKLESDLRDFKKVLKEAQALKFTVLVHGSFPKGQRGNEVDVFIKTINEFPNIRFVLGHLLGQEYQHLTKLKHPNFLVEISVTPILLKDEAEKKNLTEVMKKVGINKFIFGSDWPIYHPAETLKALKTLPLSDSEINQIVYTNAEALDDLFLP